LAGDYIKDDILDGKETDKNEKNEKKKKKKELNNLK